MSSAFREDAFISGLYVSMSTCLGRDGAIEVESHGDTFTGSLSMEI